MASGKELEMKQPFMQVEVLHQWLNVFPARNLSFLRTFYQWLYMFALHIVCIASAQGVKCGLLGYDVLVYSLRNSRFSCPTTNQPTGVLRISCWFEILLLPDL